MVCLIELSRLDPCGERLVPTPRRPQDWALLRAGLRRIKFSLPRRLLECSHRGLVTCLPAHAETGRTEATARICQWVRRFPPGQGRPPSSMIPLRPRGLAPSMLVRSPTPIVRLIFDGTAVRVWLDRIHRVDPGVRPRFAVSLCLLTARTPRRSGHRHRCVAYRADSARAE